MIDKQEAQTLAEGGLSIEAIAKEFGVSTATVYRWVSNKDIAQAARDDRDQALVDDYVAGKLTMKEIMAKHNCYSPQIYKALKRHSITPSRRDNEVTTDEERKQIIAMYKGGYKMTAIVHLVGRSSHTVYKTLDEAEVPRRVGRAVNLPPNIDWETIIDDTILQTIAEQPEQTSTTTPHSVTPSTPSTTTIPTPTPIVIEDIIPDTDTT